MEEKKDKKSILKKWWFWVVLIVILFVLIGASGGSKAPEKTGTVSNSSNRSVTNESSSMSTSSISTSSMENKLKEGDVISGIGRKELEDNYNQAEEKSKLKADEYLKSIKGQSVTWIAEIKNIDTGIDGVPYIRLEMGIYSISVNSPDKKYLDLEKGQIVKLSGKIDSISNTFGLTAYITADSIEKI